MINILLQMIEVNENHTYSYIPYTGKELYSVGKMLEGLKI